MSLYLLDQMQLDALKRVNHLLYDEMKKLTVDDRRDLANAMNAVLCSIEWDGKLDDEKELD